MHSAIFYSTYFFLFVVLSFHSFSSTHHPPILISGLSLSIAALGITCRVSFLCSGQNTVTIQCQYQLALLVTKIFPGALCPPLPSLPRHGAYSALVSPWTESLLTKMAWSLGLPAGSVRSLASGAGMVPGEGPEPQLQTSRQRGSVGETLDCW